MQTHQYPEQQATPLAEKVLYVVSGVCAVLLTAVCIFGGQP